MLCETGLPGWKSFSYVMSNPKLQVLQSKIFSIKGDFEILLALLSLSHYHDVSATLAPKLPNFVSESVRRIGFISSSLQYC